MCTIVSGVVTSLVTPFTTHLADGVRDTEPDAFAFEALLRWQARAGVAAVTVAGWAGEGPTLTRGERADLLRLARDCATSMAVLAAVGEPSTARAVLLAEDAEACGADALVVSLPFYNRPTFPGMRRHIEAIGEATRLPLLVELDPARTNLAVSGGEIAELLRLPRVAGLVDHRADLSPASAGGSAADGVTILAAHEPSAAGATALGAAGLFSVVANCAPEAVVALWAMGRTGDGAAARAIARRLAPLVEAVANDGVPVLKRALQSACGMEPAVRLPLHRAGERAAREIEGALAALVAASAREPAARGIVR